MIALTPFFTGACSDHPVGRTSPRVLGIDPLPAAAPAADHGEILSAWIRAGYRNMTVVHVGPRDGLDSVPAGRMGEIKARLKEGRVDAAGGVPVTQDNYLSVAARLGLINRLYWLIPYDYLHYLNAEDRVRLFLRTEASLFPRRDIESMRFKDGCVSGTLAGIETHICSPSTMPISSGTALVSIDTAFFRPYAHQKDLSTLGALKELIDQLALRRIATPSLFVTTSPELPVRMGYLADELLEVLKDPAVIRKERPPELWTVRDQADNMLSGGGWRDAARFLEQNRGAYPDDPYLVLMRSTADMLLARDRAAARAEMARLCAERSAFCRGIADAGGLLAERGDLAGAGDLFQQAISLAPSLASARYGYALVLYRSGRYADAAREGKALLSAPDHAVIACFLLGDCSYALRQEDEALEWYRKALRSYGEAGGYRLGRREQESLDRLRSLYRKRNDQQGLKALESMMAPE
jgi:tetratricopeptide (TPR) repeat protein